MLCRKKEDSFSCCCCLIFLFSVNFSNSLHTIWNVPFLSHVWIFRVHVFSFYVWFCSLFIKSFMPFQLIVGTLCSIIYTTHSSIWYLWKNLFFFLLLVFISIPFENPRDPETRYRIIQWIQKYKLRFGFFFLYLFIYFLCKEKTHKFSIKLLSNFFFLFFWSECCCVWVCVCLCISCMLIYVILLSCIFSRKLMWLAPLLHSSGKFIHIFPLNFNWTLFCIVVSCSHSCLFFLCYILTSFFSDALKLFFCILPMVVYSVFWCYVRYCVLFFKFIFYSFLHILCSMFYRFDFILKYKIWKKKC